mgnify:CR=1 FL=1
MPAVPQNLVPLNQMAMNCQPIVVSQPVTNPFPEPANHPPKEEIYKTECNNNKFHQSSVSNKNYEINKNTEFSKPVEENFRQTSNKKLWR